jgi:hypothetical protein
MLEPQFALDVGVLKIVQSGVWCEKAPVDEISERHEEQ